MNDRVLRVEFERGGVFRASLLSAEAPNTCALVLASLPFAAQVKQTRFDGMTLYFTTELRGVVENPVEELRPGQLRFCPDDRWAGIFTMTYGDRLHSPRAFNLFARIEENLDGLREAGDRVWLQGAERVSLSVDV